MHSNQQHKKQFLLLALVIICLSTASHAQSWNITGNANIASATQYLGTKDPNDLVFRTNAIERGRVFGAGGAWRFGSATNYAKIDSLGHLTFGGQGGYRVAANKYVFQYATTPNYGLFFNTTPLQYEFRNSAATPVFSINATTGAGAFTGTLKIGAYTLPATDGTSGQVLTTNGSGTASWANTNNNFWSLTGNAGTLPGSTSFLGTTDAKGLVFKTTNIERMRITNTGNIGIGTGTPDARFTVVVNDGVSLSTTDSFLLGKKTGYNLAFDYNDIQARNNGAGALLSLNYWGGATWIGSHSGSPVPAVYAAADGTVGIGGNNITAGYALTVNPGSHAGMNIADPVDNTAISFTKSGLGAGAIFSKTSTSSSVETINSNNAGSGAGIYAYSASGFGVDGFSTYSTGVYGGASTLGAGSSIGVNGYGNYGVYGTTADNNAYYAGYFVGDVYSTTGVYASSDQKLKENIKDVTSAMDIISRLHPKFYNFRSDGDYKLMNLPKGIHYGLIAQEVEKVLPNLVKDSKFDASLAQARLPRKPGEGEPKTSPQSEKSGETIDFKTLNYTELIPILIKGMQEQQATIDKQQQQIDNLKTMVLSLTQGIANFSAAGSNAMVNKVNLSGTSLEQNVPNPLSNTTSIHYNVPAGNASLVITGMNGKTIKQVALQTGAGVVNIDASTLGAGAYSYSLVVDGKMVATKKMMVAR